MFIETKAAHAIDDLNRLNKRITFLKKLVIAGNTIHEEELGKLQEELKIKYDAYIGLGFNIFMNDSGIYVFI